VKTLIDGWMTSEHSGSGKPPNGGLLLKQPAPGQHISAALHERKREMNSYPRSGSIKHILTARQLNTGEQISSVGRIYHAYDGHTSYVH
jgi:hypothetical protein